MTKLEFVNKAVFQWFFIRLARASTTYIFEFDGKEFSLLPDGSLGIAGRAKTYQKVRWWSLMGFIIPLTGWSGNYRYVGKAWTIRISKKKIEHTNI